MRGTDKVIQKNQNTTKNRKSDIQLQNGGQKKKKTTTTTTISMSRHKISDQNWETTFPKNFFLEIWLIKFEKKIIRLRFYGENKFWIAS